MMYPFFNKLSSSILRRTISSTKPTYTGRRRQHLNPFAGILASLKPTPESIDWSTIFEQSDAKKYHLDLGSGSGLYLSEVAKENRDTNWIGVEIKENLVNHANDVFGHNVNNYTMIWANLLQNETLSILFNSLPKGEPSSVSILHPDPNFKKRMKKRDLVTKPFVDLLSYHLDPGTLVYTQSDVLQVDHEIHTIFTNHPLFEEMKNIKKDLPLLGIPTDREQAILDEGKSNIYRRCYRRTFELI